MNERGYSLVELLVSVAILLVVLGSVCRLASPAHATALVQAEMQDMHQRARVLSDRLAADLRLAGAGTIAGSPDGIVAVRVTAILPAACCGSIADPVGTERSDRLTIVYVPRGSPAGIIAADLTPGAPRLEVPAGPTCVPSAPACGFVSGDLLVVSDAAGRSDIFTLDLSSGVPLLEPLTIPFTTPYLAGATVSRVVVRTYSRSESSNQVFVADGPGPAEPFVDRVTDLRFGYVDRTGVSLDGRLGDGPWLGAGAMLHDQDVETVRRVRVSYTIQSGLPGTGALAIPDLTSAFDVELRNVTGGS